MKKNLLWTTASTLLIVAWLSFPTVASADGPSGEWTWKLLQQTVKVVDGMAYPPGSDLPMHYSAVAQQLQKQGWAESGWSSVGGTKIAYFYFTKIVPIQSAVLSPPTMLFTISPWLHLRRTNPLYFGTETT